MQPRAITEVDRAKFGGIVLIFRCPSDMPDCEPVEALKTFDHQGRPVLKLAWQPDEIDVAALATGATVWLTLVGEGLPPVDVQVLTAKDDLE